MKAQLTICRIYVQRKDRTILVGLFLENFRLLLTNTVKPLPMTQKPWYPQDQTKKVAYVQ